MINNSYITNLGLHFTGEIKTGRMLISLQGIIHAQREAEFKQGLLDPESQLYMLLTQKITKHLEPLKNNHFMTGQYHFGSKVNYY